MDFRGLSSAHSGFQVQTDPRIHSAPLRQLRSSDLWGGCLIDGEACGILGGRNLPYPFYQEGCAAVLALLLQLLQEALLVRLHGDLLSLGNSRPVAGLGGIFPLPSTSSVDLTSAGALSQSDTSNCLLPPQLKSAGGKCALTGP